MRGEDLLLGGSISYMQQKVSVDAAMTEQAKKLAEEVAASVRRWEPSHYADWGQRAHSKAIGAIWAGVDEVDRGVFAGREKRRRSGKLRHGRVAKAVERRYQ